MRRRLSLLFGSFLLGGVAAIALLSLFYLPAPPEAMNFSIRLAPPSWSHPLGTDLYGRDVLSRLMVGAQNSLLSGILALGVAASLGIPLGALAALQGGWLEELVMRLFDSLYSFPVVLLALLLAEIAGASLWTAMIAIGLASAPSLARLTRASLLALLPQPFVEAARALGASSPRILLCHLLPNALGPLLVQSTQILANAILADAGLSYLGLGVQPPTPSWGSMLHEAQGYLPLDPWGVLWPGLAIAITVLGANLLGDGLRDLWDPRSRRRSR